MDLIKAITTRRSIRDFKDRRVEKDDLLFLCELGMNAPSAGNLQDYRFIITRDRKKIAGLPALCMDQEWIRHATGVIVICSQPKIQIKWYGEQGSFLATQNAAAAAQNILLGAHSLGLGACWVSGFDRDKLGKYFGLTGGAKVEVIIPIGYPSGKPDKKTENAIDVMVYFDTYGNDKADLALLNKDYSIKMQEILEEAKFEVKQKTPKVKKFLQDIGEQVKNKIKK